MLRLTCVRPLVGLTLAVTASLLPSPARAQAAPPEAAAPPDVVVEKEPAAAAPPAKASPSGRVFVHLDSPTEVSLQRRRADKDDAFDTVCTSPCDTYIPAAGAYRVGSDDGIRASSLFALPADRTSDDIMVDPATRGGLAGGIVLTSLGGLTLAIAFLWSVANSFAEDGGSANQTGPVVAGLGGGALVAGGLTLILRNRHSSVAFAPAATAQEVEPPWRSGPVAREGLERRIPQPGLGVPLVRIAF